LRNQSVQDFPEPPAGRRPAAGAQVRRRAARKGRASAAGCGSWRRRVAWLVLTVFYLTPPGVPVAWAAPEGMEFEVGSGALRQDGSHFVITTDTQQTIVSVNGIDVPVDQSLEIAQPGSDSRFLAKVRPGAPPTDISGELSSNAIVYILNTAGVFFGNEAVVDVGRLVAGAGALSNEDFLAGRDHFTDLSGPVEVAAGAQLHATSVALLGRTVANHGTILAPDGMIALVAGGDVLLSKVDGRVLVRVEAAPEDPGVWAVEQTGTLDAGGGSVVLAAGDAYSLAMNHSGITRARDVQLEGGDGGLVAVSGEIDASNREPGGRGGSIRVLGDRVAVLDAVLDASGDAGGGEILVGGDAHGEGELRAARRTYVGDEAVLRADALGAGDGGRVIVWADEKTGFYGTLSARGGAAGGDGGFAEISGRYSLESRGDIDLSAPAGRSGALLYDPEKIEIVGGEADGSDSPDLSANQLTGDDGTAGIILFGDDGDLSAPFVIYESEIEETEANIFLEANRSVIATGTFDHETLDKEGPDVVRLVNDNGLFIATGTPSDLANGTSSDPHMDNFAGIDLISLVVLGSEETLTWKVSGAGQLFLDTTLFTIDENLEVPQSASIRAGALEAQGLDQVTDQGSLEAISVSTGARAFDPDGAAIDVREIRANGIDAEPVEGSADPRAATAGGRVFVQADQGDVVIGRVEAVGGNALDVAENGGNGGLVELAALDGDLTLQTIDPTLVPQIDVSGGSGLAGTVGSVGFEREVGRGGSGGSIDLCAGSACLDSNADENTTPRHVFVRGDLIARGGEGVANPAEPDAATAFGGDAGTIRIVSTTGRVEAGFDASGDPLAAPVKIEVAAGKGEDAGGSGGDPTVGFGFAEIQASDDVALNANIDASGGEGIAGPGGAGGAISIASTDAAIRAGTSELRADGGKGAPSRDAEAPAASGGAAGSASLSTADGDVELGSVLLRGGTGSDVDGGAGGRLGISSGGAIAKGAGEAMTVDVSGGAASGTGSDGGAGSIALEATGDVAALLSETAGAALVVTQHAADAATDIEAGEPGSATQIAQIDAAGADPQVVRTLDTSQVDLAVTYRLDVAVAEGETAPSLVIAAPEAGSGTNGVRIGGAGASIANAGPIEAGGTGAHVTTRGTLILEGTSIGSDAAPLAAEALRDTEDAAPKLGLDAAGDVYVRLASEVATALDVVDLKQADPLATARIQSFADAQSSVVLDSIDIRGQLTGPVDEEIPSSHLVQVDTGVSDFPFTFAYRLLPPAGDTASAAARVVIEQMNLGADALIQAVGDVQIGTGTDEPLGGVTPDVAIAANGHDLSLVADAPAQTANISDGAGAIVDAGNGSAAIDMGDPGDGSSQLALRAGSGVGSGEAPLRTQRIGRVAGATADGGFYLRNSAGGDVRIAQFADVDGVEHTGIVATTGDVELWNLASGGRILLEEMAAGGTHVSSGGDQTYHGPLEIENARLDALTLASWRIRRMPRIRHQTPSNEAKLVAGGDVVFTDRIATSADATVPIAVSQDDGAGGTTKTAIDVMVPGALVISAAGVTRFATEVADTEEGVPDVTLGKLDVTDVRLARDTTFELGGGPAGIEDALLPTDLAAFTGQADFRGRIDGPYALSVNAVGTETLLSTAAFHGDIGAGERLAGLDVGADRIEFTTAERVLTGAGGIALNVPQDPKDDLLTGGAPAVATIYDTAGSIAFETTGDFETGRLQKLTALGALSIRAQGVASFSDLTALEIAVDAPTIRWKGRDPSTLLLADGSIVNDAGSDLVANDIALSSVPAWDGAGAKPVLVLGSGGVSAPASLADFDVIRLDQAIGKVTPASFAGPDGVILDLTGTGPPLVGDPTRETPREAPGPAPVPGPRIDSAAPAARPRVSGQQLLAFVRCAAAADAASAACQPARPGVAPPPGSALATERAADIAARYRTLVASSDARARLRAAFKLAVSAYRQRAGGGDVDGARLYAFLRESPAHAETLEQLNELARLFAEIEMLGLPEAGLGADAVIDAVRASAIGLPV
jgi:filamentous hemagglutinin family protein